MKVSTIKKRVSTIKDAKRKKSVSARVKTPVIQMTSRGRRIKKFKSIFEASVGTGVNSGSISKVVRGICQTAGGYRWATA